MKANLENIGQVFDVRIMTFKSFRHYGGREIKETPNIIKATLVNLQSGEQRYILSLNEPCCGFKVGHKIAVSENDLIIQ